MLKRRFVLSLLSLIGSAVLLVATTFAWFAISNQVAQNPIDLNAQGISVDSHLYLSTNGVDYTETTNIDFQNHVPGDVVYYKITITNSDLSDINTRVILTGFTDSMADASGSDENYLAGKTLLDKTLISASNNVTTYNIDNQYLSDEVISDTVTLATVISLDKEESVDVFFSLTFDPTAGNDYQNLKLNIAHIYVQSDFQ